MRGIRLRAAYTCDIRFTSQIFCHTSSDVSMPRPMPMPALEQKSAIGPWSRFGGLDQRLYVRFFADVDLPARSADLRRNGRRTFTVEIRHRDMLRTFRGKPTRQRTADPARAACNDDDLAVDSHRFVPPIERPTLDDLESISLADAVGDGWAAADRWSGTLESFLGRRSGFLAARCPPHRSAVAFHIEVAPSL